MQSLLYSSLVSSLIVNLLAVFAQAGEINLRFGVGAGNDMDFGSVKYIEAGHTGTVYGVWVYNVAGALVIDPREGYATTPLLSATTGVRASWGPLMASTSWGLAALAYTDLALSTHYQFTNLTELAICDPNGNCVGAFYRHYSNAGIKQPNLGRDFLGASVGIAF